jgi:hypothetical protein
MVESPENHPLSLPGVSVVRVDNGKIADWADYYDGLTARRTALAALYGMGRVLKCLYWWLHHGRNLFA